MVLPGIHPCNLIFSSFNTIPWDTSVILPTALNELESNLKLTLGWTLDTANCTQVSNQQTWWSKNPPSISPHHSNCNLPIQYSLHSYYKLMLYIKTTSPCASESDVLQFVTLNYVLSKRRDLPSLVHLYNYVIGLTDSVISFTNVQLLPSYTLHYKMNRANLLLPFYRLSLWVFSSLINIMLTYTSCNGMALGEFPMVMSHSRTNPGILTENSLKGQFYDNHDNVVKHSFMIIDEKTKTKIIWSNYWNKP